MLTIVIREMQIKIHHNTIFTYQINKTPTAWFLYPVEEAIVKQALLLLGSNINSYNPSGGQLSKIYQNYKWMNPMVLQFHFWEFISINRLTYVPNGMCNVIHWHNTKIIAEIRYNPNYHWKWLAKWMMYMHTMGFCEEAIKEQQCFMLYIHRYENTQYLQAYCEKK